MSMSIAALTVRFDMGAFCDPAVRYVGEKRFKINAMASG